MRIPLNDRGSPGRFSPSTIGAHVKSGSRLGWGGGGASIRTRQFFFSLFAQEAKRQENPIEIRPRLSLPVTYFPSEYQGVFGPTNATFNEDLYFGKLSFQPSNSDLIELSGKYRKES